MRFNYLSQGVVIRTDVVVITAFRYSAGFILLPFRDIFKCRWGTSVLAGIVILYKGVIAPYALGI